MTVLFGFVVLFFCRCGNGGNKSVQQINNSSKTDSAAIKLGRYLFYDNHLSFNQTKSCSSCHDPGLAFTDGYRTSTTATGDNVQRNAPSLINVVFQKRLDWANPFVSNTYQQNERPLFNEHPIELGLKNNEEMVLQYFRNNNYYRALVADAYPNDTIITVITIRKSLSAFVNSLVSANSAYDAYLKGDDARLSASAKNGMKLFFSTKLQCSSCHAPPLFSLNDKRNNISADSIYFNTGMEGGSHIDQGLFQATHKASDMGKFKVPSLRNIAFTAPYMHNGSIETLGDVIDIYSRGGQLFAKDDGKPNSNKDHRIIGFLINANEKKDLLAFLHSLTDSTILKNPLFSDPNTY